MTFAGYTPVPAYEDLQLGPPSWAASCTLPAVAPVGFETTVFPNGDHRLCAGLFPVAGVLIAAEIQVRPKAGKPVTARHCAQALQALCNDAHTSLEFTASLSGHAHRHQVCASMRAWCAFAMASAPDTLMLSIRETDTHAALDISPLLCSGLRTAMHVCLGGDAALWLGAREDMDMCLAAVTLAQAGEDRAWRVPVSLVVTVKTRVHCVKRGACIVLDLDLGTACALWFELPPGSALPVSVCVALTLAAPDGPVVVQLEADEAGIVPAAHGGFLLHLGSAQPQPQRRVCALGPGGAPGCSAATSMCARKTAWFVERAALPVTSSVTLVRAVLDFKAAEGTFATFSRFSVFALCPNMVASYGEVQGVIVV